MSRKWLWVEIAAFLSLFYFTVYDGFRLNWILLLGLALFVAHLSAEMLLAKADGRALKFKNLSKRFRLWAWVLMLLVFLMSCIRAAQMDGPPH